MNPNADSIYAGLAGVNIQVDEFELGEGLVLKKTFGHFMAPFLMAFAKPEEGKPHPGPLSAVSGGLGFDIEVQLFVPSSFDKNNFFDRLNTVWWIVALMRLRGASKSHVPVISDRPFEDIPKEWKHAKILPVEFLPRKIVGNVGIQSLSLDDLQWIKSVWLSGGGLMDKSNAFNDAFQALDNAGSMPTGAVALLTIWGVLEHLFSHDKRELRFRVSANIASFLEAPGEKRLILQKKIMKLYDARSSVAHGIKLKEQNAWMETLELASRAVIKMLLTNHVPTKEDLERELFAPQSGF